MLACGLAAGCTSSGLYYVDSEVIRMIEAPPPLAERIGRHRRRIGPIDVAIGCLAPGSDELATLYEGRVNGAAGEWRFTGPGPTRREADCDSPEALDEAAEHFALRYRKERGAVPATRQDGLNVYLAQPSLRLETRQPAEDGKVAIRAQARNVPLLVASTTAILGAATVIVAAILFVRSGVGCSSIVGCANDQTLERSLAVGFMAGGGLSLTTALVSAIFGLTRDTVEVHRGRWDRFYYPVPGADAPPHERDPAIDP